MFNTGFKLDADFDKLRRDVAAAAKSATDVVQQLNELDQMAAEDDYLKTDDLNVKSSKPKERWVEDMDDAAVGVGTTNATGASSGGSTVSSSNIAGASLRSTPAAFGSTAAAPARTPMTSTSDNPVFGQSAPATETVAALQSSQQAPAYASPEERAQQLISQALFQTPMSSMSPSRASSSVFGGNGNAGTSGRNSPVHSSSFLDYDSAKEDEEDEDESFDKMGDSNAPSTAPNENDGEREIAVMEYLSKNTAGEGFSLLDKVMPSGPATREKPSTTLSALDVALGNDLSSSAGTKDKRKAPPANSYVHSAVAALMDGTVVQEEDRVLPASAPKGTEAATKPQTNDLETTNTSKSNTDNLAGLEYDSDSSSDESDWGGSKERDPILSLLQKEGHQLSGRTSSGGTMISNVQPRHEVTIDSGIGGGGSLYDGQHGVQKKDPNRFFTDIDRRSVAHDEERGARVPQELVDGTPSKGIKQESFVEAPNKFAWFKNVATGKIIDSVVKLESALSPAGRNSAGVASRRAENTERDNRNGTTEDDYDKVISTSLLAAEEHAELERIKQMQSANQNAITKLIDLIQGNPRFAFIFLTLFLMWMTSRWTRKRTEDDVT